MRINAALLVLFSGSALAVSGCHQADGGAQAVASETASANAAADDDAVTDAPSGDASDGAVAGSASNLDLTALSERRDPEHLVTYYVNAVRAGDWTAATKAWSLDAQMTPQKLSGEYGANARPKLAVGKGDIDTAAGTLYYEAPLVVDYGDGRPSKRGTLVLSRVNDIPGASEEQLVWRIERTSTLTQ